MRKIFSLLDRLARRNVTVLLTGETGTGKTTVAEALHHNSNQKNGPFVVVNCGALPPSLIESSLFGHEKGAFTGANAAHAGYFEQADGGTIFLDEIGELPLDMQPKLLSVVEQQKVQRLGSHTAIKTKFRLIAATHRSLPKEVKEGRFREDLYYRLSPISVKVPPLRDRQEDIPLLLDSLLEKLAPEEALHFTPAAIDKLKTSLWPGNVRQLRNTLEQVIVFHDGNVVDADELEIPSLHPALQAEMNHSSANGPTAPINISEDGSALTINYHVSDGSSLKKMIEQTEKEIIERSLAISDKNVQRAAVLLDISVPWI